MKQTFTRDFMTDTSPGYDLHIYMDFIIKVNHRLKRTISKMRFSVSERIISLVMPL